MEADDIIGFITLVALTLICLLMTINPDLFWGWQQLSNEMQGVESKKTEAWGCTMRVTGLICGLIALFFLSSIIGNL